MNTIEKQNIKTKIVQKMGDEALSQNKAADKIGISSALLSQMLNNNWEQISEEKWRLASAWCQMKTSGWVVVETRNYKIMNEFLSDAQEDSNVYGIIGDTGSSKTISMRTYAAKNKRAYHVVCREYWNRKSFLECLLTSMGRKSEGLKVGEMMEEVVSQLSSQDCPLIIMDEADKLNDQVLLFFITLYNELEDRCGIVLCATDHLEKRIKRGVRLNKKGYKEIYSRLGRKFIELAPIGSYDITQICTANGVTDKSTIETIVKDSELDLRRVERLIHKYTKKARRNAAQKGEAAHG